MRLLVLLSALLAALTGVGGVGRAAAAPVAASIAAERVRAPRVAAIPARLAPIAASWPRADATWTRWHDQAAAVAGEPRFAMRRRE